MTDLPYSMSPSRRTEVLAATATAVPQTRTAAKKVKLVSFSADLVSGVTQALQYDRTALPSDIFSCDVCSLRIPCGIRGYEPYGTCAICEDGFDVCGSCCGAEEIMQHCSTPFVPGKFRPKLRIPQHHQHDLHVIDRAAEIRWANENCAVVEPKIAVTAAAAAGGKKKKKKSHSKGRQRATKKMTKRKYG